MRVVFQGEPGAYSEQALLEAVPDAQSLPAPLLRDVFETIARGGADAALVPCENSQAGSINETYDLLLEFADQLRVAGEHELRVRHCLLGVRSATLPDIRVARSHPQALAQTAEWLRARGIVAEAHADTAGAARSVADAAEPGVAAVASRRAADVYGLEVLAEDIEDNPTNRTRFLLVVPARAGSADASRADAGVEGKTSLVLSTENRPGALYRALGCLAAEGVNLLKLESRPSRGVGWEYVFYVDCSGWGHDPALGRAIVALRTEAAWVRVLGSYPRTV